MRKGKMKEKVISLLILEHLPLFIRAKIDEMEVVD